MDSSSAAPRVAIVGDDDPTFVEDLRASLQAAGIRSRVLTVPMLNRVVRAPDLTLVLGDAAQDGGVGVVDRVGEDRGPVAVVLAAGSLSVRLEARTRGLSVIPRPNDGASLGRDVERLLDSAGVATDVTLGSPRMAMNPGAPVADLDWEDDSETIQHVEAEAERGESTEAPAHEERESLPEIGSGPSGLGRIFPRRQIGYRTTLQGLSDADQDVTEAAPERSTKPASRRRRNTQPAKRIALPEAKTRMVPHPEALGSEGEANTRVEGAPLAPSSETRVVPDPTAPLYEEPTRHAPTGYTKQLADAFEDEDPDATAPHRAPKSPTRKPTSSPSERPRRSSDLPPNAAPPKRPSTPPRTSQPPPRGVRALRHEPQASAPVGPSRGHSPAGLRPAGLQPADQDPARADTAKLASPGRAGPPSAPSAPSAPPIPLLPKPPQPVQALYSKPLPPAKPPARSRPRLAVSEEPSDTGAPIPLVHKSRSAPSMAAAPPAEPAPAARWPMVVGAMVVLGILGSAAAWLLLPATVHAPVPVSAPSASPPVTTPAPPDPAGSEPSEPAQPPDETDGHADGTDVHRQPASPVGSVDVHEQLRAGRRHLRGRRWDEARAAFHRVLSQGDDPDAHEGLAKVALAQERADEALEHAEAAVELRRTRARYHRLLGDARQLGGDELGARRAYERAVSLDPEDEAAARLDAL